MTQPTTTSQPTAPKPPPPNPQHPLRRPQQTTYAPEPPWPIRLPHLFSQLTYHTRSTPHALICLPEVLHHQLLDILAGLNSGPEHRETTNQSSSSASALAAATTAGPWVYYGIGCDDGVTASEYAPILYRGDRWRRLGVRTLWLSETPEVAGSKGWDVASVRALAGLGLESLEAADVDANVDGGVEGRRVVVLNTHLDDQGVRSRVEGARLILGVVRAVTRRRG